MACVASWYSLPPVRPRTCHSNAFSNNRASVVSSGIAVRSRKSNALLQCCENKQEKTDAKTETCFGIEFQSTRRQVVLGTAFAAFSFPHLISNAFAENDVPEGFRVYTDDVNKFKILIPQGAGEPTGFKSVTAFYPEQEGNSSISVVITGLGPDFTKMESFGKVEAFAETLVSGLDRSWQRPAGVAAKLIDCKASKGLYFIEYSLQKPGESCKHLFSALGMATNGWYNRLYTVTGQYVEEESDKYSANVKEAVKSFRFI
ncbi:psbP domain-containing protein 3, chloroplastic isoform X4 [Pyrus x bretschneideri]|uniref:psbP domain-containing protein 3, chloroplastic isoform X4 n=1 Tax=Pyrus x bretschneideri TaxID=225117 RepID=UPI002030E433|nr:psbP domain-containing protein 3, chloroplastic isoform X4 [Pyrus x bretschneideri]